MTGTTTYAFPDYFREHRSTDTNVSYMYTFWLLRTPRSSLKVATMIIKQDRDTHYGALSLFLIFPAIIQTSR